MKEKIAVFWFRRDLRLEDNAGLFFALSENKNVLPIFIFDPEILESLPKNDARVQFIYNTLTKINNRLLEQKKSIQIFHDSPNKVFHQLNKQFNINTVYTNHDYEPYALERDKTIASFLSSKNIEFKTYKDQVIFEKSEIVKADGNPYLVYTPYKNKWKTVFRSQKLNYYPSENLIENIYGVNNNQHLFLQELGFKNNTIKVLDY